RGGRPPAVLPTVPSCRSGEGCPLRPARGGGSRVFDQGRRDRSRSRATSAQSGRIPTHEPERRRRLSLPAARAAPPASSRPFPPLGPSQRLPSSSTCLCAVARHLPNSFAHERKYCGETRWANDPWLLNRCHRRGAQKSTGRYKHLLLTSKGSVSGWRVLVSRRRWQHSLRATAKGSTGDGDMV